MIEGIWRKKLETFLRRQLFDKEGCIKLVVRHIDDFGKARHEVDTVAIPKAPTPEHLDNIIDDISQVIELDAQEMDGGPPKYGVFAIFPKPEDTARFLYRAKPRGSDDDGMTENEPPTKAGVTAMAMRHADGAIRSLVMGSTSTLKAQADIIERQNMMINALMSKHLDYVNAIESARSQQHDREMESMRTASSIEHKDRMMDKFFLLGGVALKRLKGGSKDAKELDKLEPATTSDVMILQIFESMNDEQKEQLMNTLSIEQKVAFLELQQHLANKFAKDKANGNGHKSDGKVE